MFWVIFVKYCDPLIGKGPLHDPEAVHEVTLVELHVKVVAPPELTDVGLLVKTNVGVLVFNLGAEQGAVVPPLLPAQLQFHGPLPVTLDAVPTAQRSVVGALATATVFALPHRPLTAAAVTAKLNVAFVLPAAFVALIPTLYVLAVVGVPLIRPLVAFTFNPAGKPLAP